MDEGLPDISILVPSRNRPDNLVRLYTSLMSRAKYPKKIEIISYIDDDDDSYENIKLPRLTIIQAPSILLAEAWNECWRNSVGDWLGLFGDDVIFKTDEWDVKFREATSRYPDNIGFFFGDDLSNRGKAYGTHGFIHKTWAEAVGYFVPPYFSADYVDTWLNDVATKINRIVPIDIVTEHLHVAFGKAPNDATYRQARQRSLNDKTKELFESKEEERQQNADKLKELMNE